MSWKIWIWVSHDGIPQVGVKHYGRGWQDAAADCEHVYGSQIRHRVAALTPDGWRIMTPSDAKKMGYHTRLFY